MNQAIIEIPDRIRQFDTLEHCCDFLNASNLNREFLDLRSHSSPVIEGSEAGWERGLDRGEGGVDVPEGNCRQEFQTGTGTGLRGNLVAHFPVQIPVWD